MSFDSPVEPGVQKRRVLLTGATGYLGGRILQGLSHDPNIELLLVTRRPEQVRPNWVDRGTMRHIDFNSADAWTSVCMGIDQVIHLISPNAGECGLDPGEAIRVNIVGTKRVLDAAIAAGVRRFIYMSSAHVYGNLSGVITEECLATSRHPYSITKQAAESFVLAAHDQEQIEAVVFRLSNSYGNPTHADVNAWMLLVNDLCRQAVMHRELRLRSSGVQVRDFIAIADVVQAVQHSLLLPVEKLGNGLFNLGGDDAVPIQTMAERIAKRCEARFGFLPTIHHPPPKPHEQSQFLLYSSEKLKNTGYRPARQINEEIDATLDFCQKLVERGSG